MTSQLHQLLLEFIPGGAKKDLSSTKARVLVATVRPRDIAGKTRRRVAAELVRDLETIRARKKAANNELTELRGIRTFGRCSSAVCGTRQPGLTPDTGFLEKPLPGPANSHPKTPLPAASRHRGEP